MRRPLFTMLFGVTLLWVGWTGCSDDEETGAAIAAAPASASGSGGGGSVTQSASSAGGATSSSSGGSECNPVTNEGCARGQACDVYYTTQTFQCYEPPNDNDVCTSCGQMAGWCKPTYTCQNGYCAKYCCNDGDCSPSGICDKRPFQSFEGSVGVCMRGEGGGGTGGAVSATHDCAPPFPSPSQGTCFEGVGGAGGAAGAGGAGGTAGAGGMAGMAGAAGGN